MHNCLTMKNMYDAIVAVTRCICYRHMPIGRCGYIVYCSCFLFVCLFVCTVTDFSAEDKAASNYAGRFISVQGRKSPIFVNFAPPEAQNRTNWPSRPCCNVMLLGFVTHMPIKFALRVDVRSVCVDIRQSPSPKTDVLVLGLYALHSI